MRSSRRASRCSRTWEAEAVEDGRVGELERTSFQRHAAGCVACGQAVSGLAQLREVMSHLRLSDSSDFERHRQRTLLLEQAARHLVRPERRRVRRLPALLAMATISVVAVTAGVFGVSRIRSRMSTANDLSMVTPRYEVTGLQEAVWSQQDSGGIARVKLDRGSAEFHVHHLKNGQRFLVELPDGEIEVRGTRFVVSVGGSGTRYVVVTEGKVVFRPRGGAGERNSGEKLLMAGDRWDRAPEAEGRPDALSNALGNGSPARAVEAAAVSETIASAAVGLGTPTPRRHHRSGQMRGSGIGTLVGTPSNPKTLALGGSSRSESGSRASSHRQPARIAAIARPHEQISRTGDAAAVVVPPADTAFSEGISAFRGGRYDEAERVLRAFLANHPNDPRAEDAAFLRAVARSRVGDRQGAAVLAREYLRRFPAGLRRPEAESLSIRSP